MIKYVVGDVRAIPHEREMVFIPHCCNNIDVMGSGVAKALYNRWPKVKDKYHESFMKLGTVSYVKEVDDRVVICNMIGQNGVKTGENENGHAIGDDGKPPVRYSALCLAMMDVAGKLEMFGDKVEIHCPLFGCDLAGGDWYIVSTLIEEIWCPLCPVTCVLHPSSVDKYQHLINS